MSLLSEIKRIKKMINLFEGKGKIEPVAIIGDKIAKIVSNGFNNEYPELIDGNMDYVLLNNRLTEYEEVEDQVKDVFLSIGSEDFFDNGIDIATLLDNLDRIFPNAEIHLIRGYVDIVENGLDEKNMDLLEDNSVSFYRLFQKNNINTIGNHEIFGDEGLDFGDDLVIDLVEKIKEYYNFTDDYSEDDEEEEQGDEFEDLDIDDKTDFDAIYEFLSNLEKMVKSKNVYDIKLKDKYMGDIEILQIALKFLKIPFSESLEINGKYDEKTKKCVEQFQSEKAISPNGVADSKTLEELLWDLKVKSFDDDDLFKFISGEDIEIKSYTPDVYDLEDIIDNIINNIEGGYAAPEHFRASAEKQKDPTVKQALLNSGETMFGIDRKNGPKMDEFWGLVDENSGYAPESFDKDKWTHGYMGGDVEDELRELVYEWAVPLYEDYKNSKMSSELRRLVDEDKRLATHFMYACWNGVVFYNEFKNILESEISGGNTDRDSLWQVAINSRKNHSNGVMKKTAPKVENIANM
jgi:peptidoglycan hydrolase-like protein with peptidoglycan-binding domain